MQPKFSQSADKNKDVILEQLNRNLTEGMRVLEVASGTGQHALHFSAALKGVLWQPSDHDLEQYGLLENLTDNAAANLLEPIVLNIDHWPSLRPKFDAIYSANCIHVTNWKTVENYVEGVGRSLKQNGLMMLYGPFKYKGEFTTESNADFDSFLGETYPGGGIRDFEAVDALATNAGLSLVSDTPMPSNNQFIVWQKKPLSQ